MRSRAVAAWAAIFVTAGALAGCSAQEHAPAGPDVGRMQVHVGEVDRQPLTGSGEVELPLDAYLPSDEDNVTLQRAEAAVINKCLRELGYSHNPVPALGPSRERDRRPRAGWSALPAAQAARYGFDVPPDGETSRRRARADDAWEERQSGTQRSLLAGEVGTFRGKDVPGGGCVGKAAERLTERAELPHETTLAGGIKVTSKGAKFSARNYVDMHIEAVRSRLVMLMARHPRIVRMERKWSACMTGKGYDYARPADALNDEKWAGPANGAERAAASHVSECETKADYMGVQLAVSRAFEKAYVQGHHAYLGRLRGDLGTWLKNAEAISEAAAES